MISGRGTTSGQVEEAGRQADAPVATSITAEESDVGCGRCHTCDNPTPEYKCLPVCTRRMSGERGAETPGWQGPDVIVLSELADVYLPVPFDHKGHAEMAEMARGCVTCHHYTPEGWPHPACKTCHAVSDNEANIDKPALRGAYHQQCLNCHREWINERDCDICHREKAGGPRGGDVPGSPTKDDILGQMHPPIPEPDTDIYRGASELSRETRVIFRHREHVRRFGLKCVECHHERSCARCHTRDKQQAQPRTLVEHHRQCVRCHKRDMNLAGRDAGRCEGCHWREGQPKPGPFDHADTGWPLGRYHANTGCRACHASVPFVKRDGDCNTCHRRWNPGVFDHRVTGQVLDENHVEQECELCHIERRFDRPPRCDECHDEEDEGISFPTKRPGPRVRFTSSQPAEASGLD